MLDCGSEVNYCKSATYIGNKNKKKTSKNRVEEMSLDTAGTASETRFKLCKKYPFEEFV